MGVTVESGVQMLYGDHFDAWRRNGSLCERAAESRWQDGESAKRLYAMWLSTTHQRNLERPEAGNHRFVGRQARRVL